jgi:tetratricopeptide (TPR) repeat protein
VKRVDIKKKIADDAQDAISFLLELVESKNDQDEEIMNPLITIAAELKRAKKENLLGTGGSNDDFQRHLNNINANLLKIVDILPEHYFNETTASTVLEQSALLEPAYIHQQAMFSQVTGLIQNLIDIDIQYSQIEDNPLLGSYLNTKRQVNIDHIMRISIGNGLTLSSSQYTVIAVALHNVLDNIRAEQYFKKAIEIIDPYSDSVHTKLAAMRSYAYFLYNLSRYEDGAKQYESAIVKGNSDFDQYLNGYTWQMKFNSEASHQRYQAAKEAYEKAKACYEQIKNVTVRNHNLNGLEAMMKASQITV